MSSFDARRQAGWLAIPVFVIVLALVGMGTSTEGRQQFTDRQDRGSNQPAPSGQTFDTSPTADPGSNTPALEPAPPADPDPATAPGSGDQRQITIVTEEGDIVVTTDGERVWLQPIDQDTITELDPDDLVGVRITDDGQLEVVPLDQIRPEDTVVTPADNGFDLNGPDGTRVEFRVDGRNGGITATEITPDGQSVELEPNDDGSVTLSDGTTVGPIDTADPGTFGRIMERTRGLPWRWIVAGLGLLTLVSIALATHLHRRRPGDGLDLDQLAGADVPDDRFDRFLAGLAADTDPTRAVRIGFSVAERGLGGVPPRRADETPFEWHHRVEAARPGFGALVGTICDLFARARFTPSQATEEDRQVMIDALRRLHAIGRTDRGTPGGHGGQRGNGDESAIVTQPVEAR